MLVASEISVEKKDENWTKTKNWADCAVDELSDFGQGWKQQFRDKSYEILPCSFLTLFY